MMPQITSTSFVFTTLVQLAKGNNSKSQKKMKARQNIQTNSATVRMTFKITHLCFEAK